MHQNWKSDVDSKLGWKQIEDNIRGELSLAVLHYKKGENSVWKTSQTKVFDKKASGSNNLSIVASIFTALDFLAGFRGMRFDNLATSQ